ncbi:MAG: 30S ribosome-binding factor RbfA [Gammaproteobacteria bacterium]|nr:30S ribosome-binding factor RbfA [Gammaproteobacteria bacterium]
MPREFSRTRRVEEQLRRDLAELIRHEIKEPGLGMISIAEIRVSPDLNYAQVYVSILQDDEDIIDYSLETLRAYAGKLRSLLGKRMHIRRVPELVFIYDDLIQRGTALSHVIEEAVEEDHKKADQYHTKPGDSEEDNG